MANQNDVEAQVNLTKGDPILIIEQQTVIAVTQIDANIISGNFASINWLNLQSISNGIMSTISSAGITDGETLEAHETLRRDPTSNTISPCIHIYCQRSLSELEADTIRSLCLYQSSYMLHAPARRTGTDDMFNNIAAIDLTELQKEAAENGARAATAGIGSRLTHPISIIDGQKMKISELAGKVQKHTKNLISPTENRIVNAMIDLLGYSQFTLRLITDDGKIITGNYTNHEDFPALAELLRNQKMHPFVLSETIADTGKNMTSISLADHTHQ